MKTVLLFLFLGLLAATSEAKKKSRSKFDGDFEFEEDEAKFHPSMLVGEEKKRWIHDPDSDLCTPLKCKKKQLCLLEDAFTAVCVSKADLHRTGDLVIAKNSQSKNDEKKIKPTSEPSEDDAFYDDETGGDDDFDNGSRCKPCPVVKPEFLCGADNRTYSSYCRLDYHNCIHRTNILVACKGFCPCHTITAKNNDKNIKKNGLSIEKQQQLKLGMSPAKLAKLHNTLAKEAEKAQMNNNKPGEKYTFTPQDFKYDNKHYKYIKYTKSKESPHQRGHNDVLENKGINNPYSPVNKECKPSALQAMGNRLLDWFSVLRSESKKNKRRTPSKTFKSIPCKTEVEWMFENLDTDKDERLSITELFDFKHDQRERCISPFLDQCETDNDVYLTPQEWCRCFDRAEGPCAAYKRRITADIGAYVPDCDSDGYYKPTQCHASNGLCWCVNKHGSIIANTRTHGKPNCEFQLKKTMTISINQDDIDDNDDDEGDDDDDSEGSADKPLEF